MTTTAIRGAFDAVCAFNKSIHDWYDEKSFSLFYYAMCADPKDMVLMAPLTPSLAEHVTHGISAARSGFLSSATTQAAAGDHAKPSYGNVWAGCMVHMQNSVRPAMDLIMRSGMGGPMRIALLGLTALMLLDFLYGGHLRDTAAQVTNSLTLDMPSNKVSDEQSPGEAHARPRDGARLSQPYATPSVS